MANYAGIAAAGKSIERFEIVGKCSVEDSTKESSGLGFDSFSRPLAQILLVFVPSPITRQRTAVPI